VREQKRETKTTIFSAAKSLYSQTLAAFGAACINYSATTTGFHAYQKAMGTGAAGFRRLVSAFHGLSKTGRRNLALSQKNSQKSSAIKCLVAFCRVLSEHWAAPIKGMVVTDFYCLGYCG
jgi:hypothetical protein